MIQTSSAPKNIPAPIAPVTQQHDPTKRRVLGAPQMLVRQQVIQRIVTGAGSGGTTVGCAPGTGASWACEAGPGAATAAGPADGGAADALAVLAGGAPPGSTTTRVPTLVRSNRSETSSFRSE